MIASFTGFAPINDPAVTILVSLDSPVGLHEGGMVAAPVFKRIAEQVLPYLDVPRDVPLSPKLMQAAYKHPEADESATLEDFTPVDFQAQPDRPPAQEKNSQPEPAKPSITVALDEGGDIAVPDLRGKTMEELKQHTMEAYRPEFPKEVKAGDILVAGRTPAIPMDGLLAAA